MEKVLLVTIPDMIYPDDLVELKKISEVTYHETDKVSESELQDLCLNQDYLMLNLDVIYHLSPEFYEHENIQNLKAICADTTGMDWVSPHAADKHSVLLLNTPGFSTDSVAESSLTEALLHAHKRHATYTDLINSRPMKTRKGINLKDRTAGIVGMGDIGRQIASLAKGIGMNVITWNRSNYDSSYKQVSLEDLFSESDAIFLAVKLVTEGDNKNTGMINSDLLNKTNQTILVNLARPELVDERSLQTAIEEGKIIGYSIDGPSPYLEELNLKQVHLSPHDAWFTDESLNSLRKTWVENQISCINGSPQNVYKD